MSQNGKLMPNLDQQGTKLLNLTVLQRIDSYVEEILITAAHVTFYEFNIELSQWSRKDVEGSLFVVKRSAQPRFQFIVMNRRNTENLVEDLLGDFEYEIQVPYLLYRNASQEVNGIWFYNTRECEEVANLFSRILNAYSKVPQKLKVSPAKSEFEELEAVPTLAAMDGPLEPASDTDIPNDPGLFVNFFSNAMNINKTTSGQTVGQPYQSSSSSSSAAMIIPNPNPPNVPSLVSPCPAPSSSIASASLMALLENNSEIGLTDNNHPTAANLLKPSFFSPPTSSSAVMMVPPPVSSGLPSAPQFNPYGSSSPLLQPFPPPTPSRSLAPAFSRDKVRAALLMLVQDDQFIDMVHRALLNAHHS
ncbi:mRNA-decapping enzyme-like protein [Impatiens glandulifera]|uniref:mRNA-decapping enzyme-like protein n=1 Tax=Impatiens glandulifera TaxID=253017 RepID=UPI001FB04B4F|nr:mRNA-decapping enzyme-like protein [Impatiens glandulifera]